MKPEVVTVLRSYVELVQKDLPAQALAIYAGQQVLRGTMLLGAVAEEFDRAAQRRVSENAALRVVFGKAAALVDDKQLAGELRAAALSDSNDDLRVSALDTCNRQLRSLLIRLQEWLENRLATESDARYEALLADIWAELRLSTERRRLSLDRF